MRHNLHNDRDTAATPPPFVLDEGCNAVVIAIGSNQEKEINIPAALNHLRNLKGLDVQATSAVLETEAIGPDGLPSGQETFYNLALWAYTTLTQSELAVRLRQIEFDMGRRRSADKFAARPIDLDIAVFYTKGHSGMEVFTAGDIHLAYHLAAPIAEILPSWMHPTQGITIAEIACRLAANLEP